MLHYKGGCFEAEASKQVKRSEEGKSSKQKGGRGDHVWRPTSNGASLPRVPG
jgi:hypothetical protein